MTEEKKETSVAVAAININERGIVPTNNDELVRIAKLMHESGLAPDSFRTWQQVTVAMGMCLELRRPILTGIQDMAVIKGRVGIFGDAALALVRASGLLETFEEWSEGTPYTDNWVFYCKVKRRGWKENVAEWSWLDAKRAGFDDPKTKDGRKDIWSPWTRFPRRMMQFKARNFPLRDEFGDILKGVRTTEEIEDAINLERAADGSYATPSDADIKEKLKAQAPPGQTAAETYGPTPATPKESVDAEQEAEAEQAPPETQGAESRETPGTQDLTQEDKERIIKIGGMQQRGLGPWLKVYWLKEMHTDVRMAAYDRWLHLTGTRLVESQPPEFLPKEDGKGDEQEPLFKDSDDTTNWNGLKACPKMDGNNIPKVKCKDCSERAGCPAWQEEDAAKAAREAKAANEDGKESL